LKIQWFAATRPLARNRIVSKLLDTELNPAPMFGLRSNDVCIGWGRRPAAERLRARASRVGASFISVEDGFLRSFFPGQKYPGLSIVVDSVGVHYDATAPSALENLLNSDADLFAEYGEDLERARALICELQLSKYNHAPLLTELPGLPQLHPSLASPPEHILIVDQTFGDRSVDLGLADEYSFIRMLSEARRRHPNAMFYLKTHPEVSSGAKRGYLTHIPEDERLVKLTELVNPVSLMEQMDHVYVVSSTMGFEALLLGKPVTCFGMPWYAGWGVTTDELGCARRQRRRAVMELFAAAYFKYSRYWNPYEGRQGTIFEVIRWLGEQRERAGLNAVGAVAGAIPVHGMQGWKRRHLKPVLAAWSQGRSKRVSEIVWGNVGDGTHVEDGFIRSVGLGSDLVRPLSLVFDQQGMYFDATRPSDLEEILQTGVFPEEELARARQVRGMVVSEGLTKYNVDAVTEVMAVTETSWSSGDRPVILVPGQVEDDASIRFGCVHGARGVDTNLRLLMAVRSSNPNAYIVYKPHPDVLSGNRLGHVSETQALQWADHVETMASVISCLGACDSVHTMTSLTGFDALLREIPVFTYGMPFYAGWGLTTDVCLDVSVAERRTRRLSLDQLVAGVLLRYPVYWDWDLCGFTRCEATIARLLEQRTALQKGSRVSVSWLRRPLRKALGWLNLDNSRI
jgi:capsular polysaccharide export protein